MNEFYKISLELAALLVSRIGGGEMDERERKALGDFLDVAKGYDMKQAELRKKVIEDAMEVIREGQRRRGYR